VTIPAVAPLRQIAPQPTIADVAAEVRRQWRESRVAGRIHRGSRVAVGVGSRGIANVATIVRATLDSLRDMGAQPFVVNAPFWLTTASASKRLVSRSKPT
jgi:hypothetical protein